MICIFDYFMEIHTTILFTCLISKVCPTNVLRLAAKETTVLLMVMSVFKLPVEPEVRSKWITALHLVDIHTNTFVCEKNFRDEDILRTYSVPSGPNASLQEFPRKVPVLRDDAVPCFLPGCPTYLSAPVGIVNV